MKISKHPELRDFSPRLRRLPKAIRRHMTRRRCQSLVASIFTKLRLPQRVQVLQRLLMPVGPMALAVLGGGAFVKFVAQAHWPRMSISLADAARVTSSQVFELVRYVEQSNPQVLQQVMGALMRDAPHFAVGPLR